MNKEKNNLSVQVATFFAITESDDLYEYKLNRQVKKKTYYFWNENSRKSIPAPFVTNAKFAQAQKVSNNIFQVWIFFVQ